MKKPLCLRVLRIFPLFALLASLASYADEPAVNWPLVMAPQGENPALVPSPANYWMEQYVRNFRRARSGPIDLLFQGDSITEGWRTPGVGKEVWEENYGKLNAASFGIGGDKVENVLWRLRHGEFGTVSPKLVVLMIGTNNGWRDSAERIAEGVATVVADIRQLCPKSHILLLGVFPRAERPDSPERRKNEAVNALLAKKEFGPEVTYLDLGKKFLEPDGTLSRKVMPDLLHPNRTGYEIWAREIRPVVEKYVGPTK